MKTTFKVDDTEYTATISKADKGEEDKHNPYQAVVSGQPGGDVQGRLQVTDEALKVAGEKASTNGSSADDLLAEACGRSLVAELVIRKLRPGFGFVVDYRWL